MEGAAALEETLVAGPPPAAARARPRKPAKEPKWPSRQALERAQERVRLEQQIAIGEAHEAARRVREASADAPPAREPDAERRIDEIGARSRAERPPRIRRLW